MLCQFLLPYALLAWASTSVGSPIGFNDGALLNRDLKSCNDNIALSALKALKATAFCTQYLSLTTKTLTNTATSTAVVPVTITVSTTATGGYTVSQSATISVASTTTVTATAASSSVTITSTQSETATVTSVVTDTTTSTATTTTYVKDKRKRDLNVERRAVVIPSQLKSYASAVISTACNCYVTGASTTKVVTATAKTTSTKTETKTVSTSTPATTQISTITQSYTVSSTTTVPGATSTSTLIVTSTVATSTVLTTTTTSVATTTTVAAAGIYTQQFSGDNSAPYQFDRVQQVEEAYTTRDRLFEVCAPICASYGAQCGSFFAVESIVDSRINCAITFGPYNPEILSTQIPKLGAGVGYNAPS